MPHIPLLRPDDASQEVKDVYEDFSRRMRFLSPPHFIMTQGHSVSVAQGTWDLVRNVLVDGKIDRWIKELVFVGISRDRNCQYCVAAHVACCRLLKVDPPIINSVLNDIKSINDLKLRDTLLFAVKCSRDPQKLSANDFAALRQHGLGYAEFMELVAMSALAVYANIIADATGMEPDAMFEEVKVAS